jgi:hypothetical protein
MAQFDQVFPAKEIDEIIFPEEITFETEFAGTKVPLETAVEKVQGSTDVPLLNWSNYNATFKQSIGEDLKRDQDLYRIHLTGVRKAIEEAKKYGN